MEQGEIAHFVLESTRIAKEKGFHENFNLKEKLFLLISELSEATLAYKNNEHALLEEYKNCEDNPLLDFNPESYKYHIEFTFESELANFFIRFGYLCGYLQVMPSIIPNFYISDTNSLEVSCYNVLPSILMIAVDPLNTKTNCSIILTCLVQICEQFGVANINEYINLELQFFELNLSKYNKKY